MPEDLAWRAAVAIVVWLSVFGGIAIMVRSAFRAIASEELPGRQRLGRQSHVNANQIFLAGVRGQSCYRVIRVLHECVIRGAMFLCVVLWLVLLYISTDLASRLYSSLICCVVLVALVIERGLFGLVVDAADIFIAVGRHLTAESTVDRRNET